MNDNQQKVLDKEQWKAEACAIINDVVKHVQDIHISDKLPCTNKCIHLNLTTLEGLKYCVEVSGAGFMITGNQHDAVTDIVGEIFETPYSLLDFVSPKYRESFGNDLVNKLNQLSRE